MCGGSGAFRFPPPYRSARKCGRDDDRLKKTKILLTRWEVQNGKPVYENNRVEICLKYQDERAALLDALEQRVKEVSA